MKCARRFEKWRLLLFYYFILLFLSTQALRQINLKVKMARSGSLLWDLGFAQIDLDLLFFLLFFLCIPKKKHACICRCSLAVKRLFYYNSFRWVLIETRFFIKNVRRVALLLFRMAVMRLIKNTPTIPSRLILGGGH